MSNFKFLLSDQAFAPFAEVAMAAEKILHIDPAACILNCRRSMEFAVKWMYSEIGRASCRERGKEISPQERRVGTLEPCTQDVSWRLTSPPHLAAAGL